MRADQGLRNSEGYTCRSVVPPIDIAVVRAPSTCPAKMHGLSETGLTPYHQLEAAPGRARALGAGGRCPHPGWARRPSRRRPAVPLHPRVLGRGGGGGGARCCMKDDEQLASSVKLRESAAGPRQKDGKSGSWPSAVQGWWGIDHGVWAGHLAFLPRAAATMWDARRRLLGAARALEPKVVAPGGKGTSPGSPAGKQITAVCMMATCEQEGDSESSVACHSHRCWRRHAGNAIVAWGDASFRIAARSVLHSSLMRIA